MSVLAAWWSSPAALYLILSAYWHLASRFGFSIAANFSYRLFAPAATCDSLSCVPSSRCADKFSKTVLSILNDNWEIKWNKKKLKIKIKTKKFVTKMRQERTRDESISGEWKKCGKKIFFWLLRCWRVLFCAPSAGFVGVSLLISVLTRLIFKICSNSFTADCGILNVFAQSIISWTVMSVELLKCVLLVNSSSNGSNLMLISSSTCWLSSLVRVIVIGTETSVGVSEGVGDGGTICWFPVMTIESLALRFLMLMPCRFIGVIVMSLFSISFKI